MTEIFAHRGSAHLVRENTVEAFLAARHLFADGIELDVHRSADGALVVHHDAEVAGIGSIAGLRSEELPDWVPSLGEALDACRPLRVNVEIKYDDDSGGETGDRFPIEVATLLAGRAEAAEIIVSSFSLRAVDAVRAAAPSLATALLVEAAADPFRALETAGERGHSGLHPIFLAVDQDLVRAAKQAGIAIRTWTVDDPERMVALAEMGVDALITNHVAVARRALGRP